LLSRSFPAGAAVAEPGYPVNLPARHLVTSEPNSLPFARQVAADVDSAISQQPPPEMARLNRLLRIRLHLALHFGDDAAALAAAARIRAWPTETSERAHAGLTTPARVAARHDAQAFEREFTRLLGDRPRDVAVRVNPVSYP
jgi:hypothetical protein